MGRQSWIPPGEDSYKVRMFRMRMVCGCYDSGGAYWGCSNRDDGFMYQATTQHGGEIFVRAKTREDAKRQVLEFFEPETTVTFYL